LLSCPLGVLFSPALGAFTLSLPPLLSCAPPCSCRARVLVVSIPVLLDPGALVLPGVLTVPLDPGTPVLSFPIPVLLPPGAVVLPLATPAFLARFVTQRTHSSGRRPIRTERHSSRCVVGATMVRAMSSLSAVRPSPLTSASSGSRHHS